MSEEDAHSAEGKEDFGGKEEKFHTIPFYFAAVLFHMEEEPSAISSDEKIINHSFEINSPPPNC